MSLVSGAHVALMFVIAGGLGVVPLPKITDIKATFIDDTVPIDPVPVIREPDLNTTDTLALPIPDQLPDQADDRSETIGVDLKPVGEIGPGSGSAVVERPVTGVRLDPRRPLSQPQYPPEMIRQGAQGAVEVEVFVQPDGRVGDARIVRSSGYDAFDRNTLEEAKRRWRLIPATSDGVATPQWYRMRVVFKLKNQ
jgi:periplasmic protein TonB